MALAMFFSSMVLPAFGGLYTSLGIDLPLPLQILVTVGNKTQSYGLYIMLGVFIAAIAARSYVRTPEGRYKLDRLNLRLPLVGRVSHLSEIARCCRSMSLLLHAGMPMTEVLSLVIESAHNKAIAKGLTDVQRDMVQGEGISRPMTKNELFLPLMVQMVRVGEETGNLECFGGCSSNLRH